MSNGRCDICGAPAAYRVKMVENGFRKVKELCEEHYQELARQAGGRRGGFRSPLESMFGSSFFDDFFGGRDPLQWRDRMKAARHVPAALKRKIWRPWFRGFTGLYMTKQGIAKKAQKAHELKKTSLIRNICSMF